VTVTVCATGAIQFIEAAGTLPLKLLAKLFTGALERASFGQYRLSEIVVPA